MNIWAHLADPAYILTSKKRLKQELEAETAPKIKKKIAILGGSTTQEIANILELFLLNQGIKPVFYQSDYNQYWQDGVFSNEKLNSFAPDIIYIHTSSYNIKNFPSPYDTKEVIEQKLQEEYEHFQTMWDTIQSRFVCPIIQNNMERPFYRLMGNKDVSAFDGKTYFISRLNQLFYTYSQEHERFFIHDIDYLASEYGLSKWHDSRAWYSYKYCLAINAIPDFAFSLSNIIKSIFGFNKKVLTLDLDNTLWGGVIGEDGLEGISIGPELPMGQAYSDFQGYIQELKKMGILLAIASKNDKSIAEKGFKHPDSILNLDDFVSCQINWERKDLNIKKIADVLQIGLDSIVFVDDNPAERQLVSDHLLSVEVVPNNDIETFIPYLDKSGFFETTMQSTEDQNRSAMYQANALRQNDLTQFSTYHEYLLSLEMTATITDFLPIDLQRIVQLTNKSNQFNLTTVRYTDGDMHKIVGSQQYIRICGRLSDKYGDNGIISLLIGKVEQQGVHVELWLMSCRVLKRGMENVMMDALIDRCKQHNIDTVFGYYLPTAKNQMVRNLYLEMGFELQEETKGKSVWKLSVHEYKTKNNSVRVVDNY